MGIRYVLEVCLLVVMAVYLVVPIAATGDQSVREVKRNKGVGNIRVMVGFVFRYKVPEDAFSGEIAECQVNEACDSIMPPFLDFDPSKHTFTGFPLSADVGTTTFICVKAIGKKISPDSIPAIAKDVFAIEVDVGLTPAFACPEAESVVLATVYTDLDLPQLGKEEIFRILESVSKALDIPVENIRFTRSRGKYDPSRNPVIFAGKGDSKGPKKHQGARIQFQVGCSGDSLSRENRFVKYLEENAGNGVLSEVIGYPVLEWVVAKGFPRGNAPKE